MLVNVHPVVYFAHFKIKQVLEIGYAFFQPMLNSYHLQTILLQKFCIVEDHLFRSEREEVR